jgi:hypothetical protein
VDGTLSQTRCVMVMPTYYSSVEDPRLPMALKTAAAYRQLEDETGGDYVAVFVDASPSLGVQNMLTDTGVLVVRHEGRGGIARQSQAGIRYALAQGAEVFARHSPEKYTWADADLLVGPSDRIYSGVVDLLWVGRTPEAMATLPRNQRLTETVISRLIARLYHPLSGRQLPEDSASGMRLMSRVGAEQLLNFDPGRWGEQWQFEWYLALDAIAAEAHGDPGPRFDSVLVDYRHPPEMTSAEDTPEYDDIRVDQADVVLPQVLNYALSLGFSIDIDPREWTI